MDDTLISEGMMFKANHNLFKVIFNSLIFFKIYSVSIIKPYQKRKIFERMKFDRIK